MLIRTASGYYMPAHFFMKIESDENLETIIDSS